MQNSVSNSESTKHLDGPKSQISLEQLLAQFRPFRTPPAPVPFDDAEPPVSKRKASQKQRPSEVREAPPARQKRKAWKTTIVVTESTDANGAKTYATTTTPLKEIRDPSLVESLEQRIIVPKPFLERMRIRQQKWEEYMEDRVGNGASNMLLISVKRQRKLKMKKHKYKKLMRRTRNLRRKLDRT
ncbi:hypothetical protein W97_03160 [Coniosporium apollinis CBS 100218]|uniref:Small ribosomal subunit protein mS38 n=1 Tax=Coniosporium apollinis (strain CBS 100218) TaxID=1168221 RepID=R7YPV8_CONA1|nr:uncharacterized protein W97_03160 [Coniosporium apollinis CBS 100218]EON63932.1 hypothetical protein W97_03160 [Coniosporium apollinis CBS 100218]